MSKTRTKSPLVVYERLGVNFSKPRGDTIKRLTPHHVAGNLTLEALHGLRRVVNLNPVGGGMSFNYGIDTAGRIGLCVEETNRAWTSSSRINDNKAITFEISNNRGSPTWEMSDDAVGAWVDLAVDICKFYGYKKIAYRPKPSTINGAAAVENWIKTWEKPDEMIITLHFWYKATTCPGPYFLKILPDLVNEINERLKPSFQPYFIRITARALRIRSAPTTDSREVRMLRNDRNVYTIVAEAQGKGANKWGKLKSGEGWISLDFARKVNWP